VVVLGGLCRSSVASLLLIPFLQLGYLQRKTG
jgi:hypothetical protein